MVRQIFHLRISPVVIGFPVDTLINRGGIGEIRVESGKQSQGTSCFLCNKKHYIDIFLSTSLFICVLFFYVI